MAELDVHKVDLAIPAGHCVTVKVATPTDPNTDERLILLRIDNYDTAVNAFISPTMAMQIATLLTMAQQLVTTGKVEIPDSVAAQVTELLEKGPKDSSE
jgi:hypothetical protein